MLLFFWMYRNSSIILSLFYLTSISSRSDLWNDSTRTAFSCLNWSTRTYSYYTVWTVSNESDESSFSPLWLHPLQVRTASENSDIVLALFRLFSFSLDFTVELPFLAFFRSNNSSYSFSYELSSVSVSLTNLSTALMKSLSSVTSSSIIIRGLVPFVPSSSSLYFYVANIFENLCLRNGEFSLLDCTHSSSDVIILFENLCEGPDPPISNLFLRAGSF